MENSSFSYNKNAIKLKLIWIIWYLIAWSIHHKSNETMRLFVVRIKVTIMEKTKKKQHSIGYMQANWSGVSFSKHFVYTHGRIHIRTYSAMGFYCVKLLGRLYSIGEEEGRYWEVALKLDSNVNALYMNLNSTYWHCRQAFCLVFFFVFSTNNILSSMPIKIC